MGVSFLPVSPARRGSGTAFTANSSALADFLDGNATTHMRAVGNG
jgi:hypothetical protein